MKKIFVILFLLLVASGCNNNSEKKDVVVNRISSKSEVKKSYYVSNVSYINHDDYYDYIKEAVKVTNIIAYEDVYNVKEESVVEISLPEIEESNDEKISSQEKEEQVIEEISNVGVTEDEILDEEIIELEEDKEETSKIECKENNLESIEEIDVIEIVSEVAAGIDEELEETKEGYYSLSGKYLGESKVKVIDVSYYQGDINWDLFAKESDCYGVILRLGYYDTLDKKFEQNISELKRLNIPYGIYLFSYATTMNGSNKEADFTNEMIDKYDLKPKLGIYYDIESWGAKNGATSDVITKDMYDNIISNYINKVSSHVNNNYKVKVYSGRWYAMNRLGDIAKSYVDWVAEYNSTCKYDGNYSMWQYTSKGSIPGIVGNVDISYLY